MKVRSTLILILWVASLGAPFLPSESLACEGACCVQPGTVCHLDEQMDECPGIAPAPPLHPIPAARVKVARGALSPVKAAPIQLVPLNGRPTYPTIATFSRLLSVPLRKIPLLI